ncbi:ergothioneine biosynthesis glutamate--cysteine ligase EgtA [Actinopolyspora mortivallis]|uniref:ergothioneine biosynthesis glutamate--cysteine ligase EgtA n=1 Tax=Actinopolyspora mortivallis TaxID=33906 RepID=UPI001FE1D9E1|nr:ergothioneine biosynthesis glutamate--cysteine ligase EgtA [Actinopolyspora mortivallis]
MQVVRAEPITGSVNGHERTQAVMNVAVSTLGGTDTEPDTHEVPTSRLRSRAEAEAYVASVCFKHGPPRLLGTELEWTVHHACDPRRPLCPDTLTRALGPYAPPTLNPDSPHRELPGGSRITVEPGGQVEISSPVHASMTELFRTVSTDTAHTRDLLGRAGLVLGDHGLDPWRTPRRLLNSPRYAAMEHSFNRIGSAGKRMMCNTAGVQVCLDAGEPARVAARWQALHALGPVFTAVFANSRLSLGRETGWASARARCLLHTDPPRTSPAPTSTDPALDWARYALDAPVVCRRRENGDWTPPCGASFAEWIAGAFGDAPDRQDLDYHLSTMFPPVRPRGYLEVRYIDAQPGDRWMVPVAALAALFRSETVVDKVLEETAAVAHSWIPAARDGLRNPELARAAAAVFDLACRCLEAAPDAPEGLAERVDTFVHGRLDHGRRQSGDTEGEHW